MIDSILGFKGRETDPKVSIKIDFYINVIGMARRTAMDLQTSSAFFTLMHMILTNCLGGHMVFCGLLIFFLAPKSFCGSSDCRPPSCRTWNATGGKYRVLSQDSRRSENRLDLLAGVFPSLPNPWFSRDSMAPSGLALGREYRIFPRARWSSRWPTSPP